MRFLVLVTIVLACPTISSATDYEPGDYIDLGLEAESSGYDLLTQLLELGSPRELLLIPESKKFNRLVDAFDRHLLAASDGFLKMPSRLVVAEVTEEVLYDFLAVVGDKALNQGVDREHYSALIERFLRPKRSSCEMFLLAHDIPKGRYKH